MADTPCGQRSILAMLRLGGLAVRMGVAMTVVTLVAVVLAIPYWRALGLIGQ